MPARTSITLCTAVFALVGLPPTATQAQVVPEILQTPLPERGAVPSIAPGRDPVPLSRSDSKRTREWHGIIDSIKKKYFRSGRSALERAEGIEELRRIDDSAAFQPMFELLEGEDDDVRLAILEHFSANDSSGQAALAWTAIFAEDSALRYEATRRIATPPDAAVLAVLDGALRDTRHAVVSHAASLANALDVLDAIPLLIFNQATIDDYSDTGDLAWIAIGTQISYVQDLIPVVGAGSGAFDPVIGTILEGTVLAIQDAIVIVYRTEVHFALRSMTTRDWGKPTEYLGYDMKRWWQWFNEEYVPYKQAQALEAKREQRVDDLLDGLESARGPAGDSDS